MRNSGLGLILYTRAVTRAAPRAIFCPRCRVYTYSGDETRFYGLLIRATCVACACTRARRTFSSATLERGREALKAPDLRAFGGAFLPRTALRRARVLISAAIRRGQTLLPVGARVGIFSLSFDAMRGWKKDWNKKYCFVIR